MGEACALRYKIYFFLSFEKSLITYGKKMQKTIYTDRHFLLLLVKKHLKSIWHGVKASKKCENNASWSQFCVKICVICYF